MHLSRREVSHYLIGFTLILIMVASATWLHDSEVILPEVGALTAGTWIYQNPGWIHQPFKVFLAPSGTALIGFLANQLTWPYAAKVLVGLFVMLGWLRVVHSTLAPSFATGLLPLIVNATHWSFMIAICVLTGCLMVGTYLQRQYSGTPVPPAVTLRQMGWFAGLVTVWIGTVWGVGLPQMAAVPPVLVVFFEVLQMPTYTGQLAVRHWLALVGAASLGVGIHLLISSWLLTTLLTLPLVFLLLSGLRLKLPAAYAFPLLALVLPTNMFRSLPVTAALAAGFFLGALVILKRQSVTVVENG
ncbi:hypothetical protein [Levilactobacillus acidifarinae]|uniref:Uncharacterized protein n=1 Tax=Levilactobacillus acidifarinae DSM 19394 = JCM 15949 TaxID=1423715 RepID=A0A0R1LXN2_9LACO|nr:hypothetical protein [Levilactobacillus acidifarinae]KRK96487.1 hypothetical protein FD25_GL001984 [Levilactobacillus acidifarinae DSM 19394]GEO68927.1 hypothetical protein LAC03_08370 [Levilactobacillus acidifarinae]